MKGINHLVLAGHDLEAMRAHYRSLGFTVTPRAQLPFGTGNSLIQLHGTYLEPLAITAPQDVSEHRPGHFSFGAFNRDYLARHEGFSMLVFDTPVGLVKETAEMLPPHWSTKGCLQPFRFTDPCERSQRRLQRTLRHLLDPKA